MTDGTSTGPRNEAILSNIDPLAVHDRRWPTGTHLLAGLLLGAVFGCASAPPVPATAAAASSCGADKKACVAEILEASGGLDHFKQLHYGRYTINDDFSFPFSALFKPWPDGVDNLVMTADRSTAVEACRFPKSPATMGVDEHGGWGSTPGLAHGAVKIGTLTSFFLALPFRLADEGATINDVHEESWRDLDVVTLDVTFDPAHTRSPNANWLVHVDPATWKVVGATFYFTEDHANVDALFEERVAVQGVVMPRRIGVYVLPLNLHVRTINVQSAELFDSPPTDWPQAPASADRKDG